MSVSREKSKNRYVPSSERNLDVEYCKVSPISPVENQHRALAAQHYAELDLFGAAVGHTTHLCLFSVLFLHLVSFLFIFFF